MPKCFIAMSPLRPKQGKRHLLWQPILMFRPLECMPDVLVIAIKS